MNKSELRKWAKDKRKGLNLPEISSLITDNIRKTEIYRRSQNILIFYPLQSEINLLSLLDDKKNFYLPRVNNELLEVCPYKKGDSLILSKLKIYEPETKDVDKTNIDLIFTPALCADERFYRIGYGGGYYDRFLSDFRGYKIIVLPDELMVENISEEETDIRCDGIITQKKSLFLRG